MFTPVAALEQDTMLRAGVGSRAVMGQMYFIDELFIYTGDIPLSLPAFQEEFKFFSSLLQKLIKPY